VIRGELARVADVEADDQRVFVALCFAGIEIKSRQQHIVPVRHVGIHAQVHERVARIGLYDDPAMLFPPPRLLDALRVARVRQDLAARDQGRTSEDQ
jgi:hypothetical protein